MTICLNEFFPTTGEKIQLLMKTIRLDWDNREQIISDILSYLHDEIPRLEGLMKEAANSYSDAKTKQVDYTSMANSRKKPNGVMLTKDELQEVRKQRDSWKQEAQHFKSAFNTYKRTKDRISKNIEQIEKLKLKGR